MLSKETLTESSMKMLLLAGDARNCVSEIYTLIENGDFNSAKEKLVEAEKILNDSHHVQTGIVQREAEGEEIPYSPLFSHAQDTMMVTSSEILTVKKLLPLFKKFA